MKRIFVLTLFFLGVSFMLGNDSVFAVKNVPDGGHREFSASKATDIKDKTLKKMWDNGKSAPTAKSGNVRFRRGGKDTALYNLNSGRNFAYDAYAGITSESNKRGLIQTDSGNYLTFDGWSIQYGHHHHRLNNQATYIGFVNKKDPTEKKLYKATMGAKRNIDEEIMYRHYGGTKFCGNNEYNKDDINDCNMHYEHTQFRAYIPLKDLFGSGSKDEEWEAYIIKRVDDNILYDELILPYKNTQFGFADGEVSLSSKKNIDSLRMVGREVIKRKTSTSVLEGAETGAKRHFAYGYTFKRNQTSEKTDVIPSFRVKDDSPKKKTKIGGREYQATGKNKWSSSIFMDFVGSQATLKYNKTKFDVTIKHKDISNGKDEVFKTEVKKGLSGKQKVEPFKKGKYQNGVGHNLVPVDKAKTVTMDRDRTVTFEYKASIPDPSRIVEMDGGKNTHGRAEGEVLWELTKGERDTEIPADEEDEYEWQDVTGGVEITKYIGKRKTLVIPDKLDNKKVVSIGNNAFNEKGLTNVIVPNDVRHIGNSAFENNELSRVGIPSSVKEIGNKAFMDNDLYGVELPNGVTKIGNEAFQGNNLTSIDFGSELNQIGSNAFRDNNLKEISLQEKLTSLGSGAFRDNEIKNVYVFNKDLSFGSNIFLGNQADSKDVVITGHDPSTAKTYAKNNNHTFRPFVNLEDDFEWRDVTGGVEITKYIGEDEYVGIPQQLDRKNVVSLGESAFSQKQITDVIIPDTVKKIAKHSFRTNNLEGVRIPSSITTIEQGAFEDNNIQNLVIPNSVTTLGSFAFKDNFIQHLTLPDGLLVIEESTFEGNSLTEVTIPELVLAVGSNAFSENNIRTINFNENLKGIYEGAFAYNKLEEVEIPEKVSILKEYAFRSNELNRVSISNKEVEIEEEVFSLNKRDPLDLTIYGYDPSTAKEYAEGNVHTFVDLGFKYRFINNGKEVEITGYDSENKDIEIPSKMEGKPVTSIGEKAFRWKGLTSAAIPKGITSIGEGAFEVNDLKEVRIPNSVISVGRNAFKFNKLEKVIIPNSVTTIEIGAFGNNNLKSADIAESVQSVGNLAFSQNHDLIAIVRGKNTTFDGVVFDEVTVYGHNPSALKDYLDNYLKPNYNNWFTFKNINELTSSIYVDGAFVAGVQNKQSLFEFNVREIDIKEKNNLLANLGNGTLEAIGLGKPQKVSADFNDPDASKLYIENNFMKTGVHYDTRNQKHTTKLAHQDESQENPTAILTDPEPLKDKDLTYNYEYEYTNHYQVDYACSDSQGSDCFDWKVDKYSPVWKGDYGKRFSLAETAGDFEYYRTGRIGKIHNANVKVYDSPESSKHVKAGSSKVEHAYYIKEKAVQGNNVFYRLSDGAKVGGSFEDKSIGWVNELDLSTYTHFNMDKRSKDVKLTGKGSYFNRVWGGDDQKKGSLASRRGQTFTVNLTETIGDDIWYRGKFGGKGSNYWVHEKYTDSIEMPIINAVDEVKLRGTNDSSEMTMKMDHKHGETIRADTVEDILENEFIVGRDDVFSAKNREQDTYYESFKKLTNDFKHKNELKTQSSIGIKPDKLGYEVSVPSGNHEDDLFSVLKKGNISGYYYPKDVDENMKEDLENYSERQDLGDYAMFLQQDEMKDNGVKDDKRQFEMDFTTDYSFISERTGFAVTYPFAYQLNRHLVHEDTNPSERLAVDMTKGKVLGDFFRSEDYDYMDELLNVEGEHIKDEEKAQRYYIPVSPESDLKPNQTHENTVLLRDVGLSDVDWEYKQTFSFEHYLLGSGHDDAWLIEQAESKNANFSKEDVNTIVIKHDDIKDIVEEIKERPEKKTHQFRVNDLDFADKIKGLFQKR